MSDIYFWIRTVNLIWSFTLFIFLVYWCVQDIVLERRNNKMITTERNMWSASVLAACFAIYTSLAEIFLEDVPGGLRVFAIWPFLVLATIATYRASHRIKLMRRAIEDGTLA